jgi:hypothetical protein
MTANKSASQRTLKSDLARVDAHVVSPKEYRELPQLTLEMLARAKVKKGGRPRSSNPRKAHFASASRRCHGALEGDRARMANTYGRAS